MIEKRVHSSLSKYNASTNIIHIKLTEMNASRYIQTYCTKRWIQLNVYKKVHGQTRIRSSVYKQNALTTINNHIPYSNIDYFNTESIIYK